MYYFDFIKQATINISLHTAHMPLPVFGPENSENDGKKPHRKFSRMAATASSPKSITRLTTAISQCIACTTLVESPSVMQLKLPLPNHILPDPSDRYVSGTVGGEVFIPSPKGLSFCLRQLPSCSLRLHVQIERFHLWVVIHWVNIPITSTHYHLCDKRPSRFIVSLNSFVQTSCSFARSSHPMFSKWIHVKQSSWYQIWIYFLHISHHSPP